ncbi:MAG TPA: GNAT family N-acetyltransferase [Candidatus Janibacter merdipullorum]|nr:GNAT family N-acetyltransferase [Candidatus Janibacter merdipullorum]
MNVTVDTPDASELADLVQVLGEWHREGGPFQLHPGDVGWFGWHGDDVTARALRVWRRREQPVAIGLLDGPGLLRLGIAPHAMEDGDIAAVVAADIGHEDGRVLPAGDADVEAPSTAALRDALVVSGWTKGDPWTHLRHDLTDPVEVIGQLRVQIVDERTVHARTAVHRAAFGSDRFTVDRWHAVAAGPAYASARCLLGWSGDDAVAAVTVWSAGEGRPGIVEPMGVHPDHRGRGHGAAMSAAGASVLREFGASSVVVGTPTSNAGAVATYVAAGFAPFAEVADLRRAEAKGRHEDPTRVP